MKNNLSDETMVKLLNGAILGWNWNVLYESEKNEICKFICDNFDTFMHYNSYYMAELLLAFPKESKLHISQEQLFEIIAVSTNHVLPINKLLTWVDKMEPNFYVLHRSVFMPYEKNIFKKFPNVKDDASVKLLLSINEKPYDRYDVTLSDLIESSSNINQFKSRLIDFKERFCLSWGKRVLNNKQIARMMIDRNKIFNTILAEGPCFEDIDFDKLNETLANKLLKKGLLKPNSMDALRMSIHILEEETFGPGAFQGYNKFTTIPAIHESKRAIAVLEEANLTSNKLYRFLKYMDTNNISYFNLFQFRRDDSFTCYNSNINTLFEMIRTESWEKYALIKK